MTDAPKRIYLLDPVNAEEFGRPITSIDRPDWFEPDDPPPNFCAYILAAPEALASSPEVAALIQEAEARGMERTAARARVYASNYEQSSDGRNTFILLAEWADAEAAAIRAAKATP